jgi:kinase suppressor of Ras 2
MADEGLEVIQSMIDFSADRLDRLRTQCATSAELTQQETRSLESKLVRLFCDLLLTRQQLSETPATNDDLRQWLRVVGLNLHTINAVMQHVNTLETLLKLNDDELCAILTNSQGIQNEETRRLVCAINNLKRCQQCVKNGTEPSDMYWDSWDRKNNIRVKTIVNNRLTTINVEHDDPPQSPSELSPPDQHSGSSLITNSGTLTSSSEKIISNNLISPEECSGISNLSPSPSPPQSPPVTNLSSSQVVSNKKKPHRINNLNNIFKTNMSSNLGNQLNNNTDVDIDMISHDSGVDGMSKSRSGDLQLSVNGHLKIWPNTAEGSPTSLVAPRTKFTIEDENNHVSALINDTSAPPRSPLTPVRGMHHIIQHRFATKFKINSTCDLCNKQLFFGLKCTECKYRCHKDCKSNVPPSCGLPKELVDEFKKTLHSEGLMPNASPNLPIRNGLIPNKRNDLRHRHNAMHNVPFHGADSSSAGSSCNSSSPSSPALLTIPPQTPANKSQFNFPEVSNGSSLINHSLNNHLPNTIIEDSELEFNQQTSLANQHFKNGDSNLCIRNNHISINESLILSEFNGSIVDSNGKLNAIENFHFI